MRIVQLPGVFRPHPDSWALARAVREHGRPHGARVLDLCTGSGLVAITAALRGAREVVAVDVCRRAVAAAAMNARLNGVRVAARRGDLFAPVDGRRFDLVVSNPPYVPCEDPELPTRGPQRAWDGGLDGRLLLDRICAGVADHLAPGGTVLLAHSSLNGVEATVERLADAGLEADVVTRRREPFGPVFASRAAWLEERGVLEAGVREEDVVVVRGRAAA